MFFADEPYVSEFLKTTLKDSNIPVVDTDIVQTLGLYKGTKIISENEAIKLFRESENMKVYTTSENSIGWISKYLSFSELPKKIELFKNKIKFREVTKSIFPDFYFRGVFAEDLKTLDFSKLPLPFIIKPATGFMSMGVYKISSSQEWDSAINSIYSEMYRVKDLYPKEVLDTNLFIIEQNIEGDEFAIDAYYNSNGEAVILNILNHIFSSEADVGDRVYISSKEIIKKNLTEFTNFADKIGVLAGVKNFPVHVELRRDKNGDLFPIEINPMRFGGWCSTADLAFSAYGFNPYLCYYENKKPDWDKVLKNKEGRMFCVVVLDNSTGIDIKKIKSFNYKKLLSNFKKPIELRKTDFRKYSVFGFLFAETSQNDFSEINTILNSNLKEFVSIYS